MRPPVYFATHRLFPALRPLLRYEMTKLKLMRSTCSPGSTILHSGSASKKMMKFLSAEPQCQPVTGADSGFFQLGTNVGLHPIKRRKLFGICALLVILSWSINSLGQSPCQVTGYLEAVCSTDHSYIIDVQETRSTVQAVEMTALVLEMSTSPDPGIPGSVARVPVGLSTDAWETDTGIRRSQ
ncbi:hypothetical protein BDP27DRAFT_1370956 [Rhodocollybia butyracea]|uniref:Uncharacterized protein n=1 Tax=Rhodocollybia butyracea TaxID=206335 RepID=A0A9P5P6T6_9AGAR|nr:hypothetical protein BDP27DRAFT_1370956 [Rhodocollybia butyracea]